MCIIVCMRTNVVLPDELIREIDKIAGTRKRSEFIAETLRGRLYREKLDKALTKARGILKDDSRFSTRVKVRSYIRKFRKENSYRF